MSVICTGNRENHGGGSLPYSAGCTNGEKCKGGCKTLEEKWAGIERKMGKISKRQTVDKSMCNDNCEVEDVEEQMEQKECGKHDVGEGDGKKWVE